MSSSRDHRPRGYSRWGRRHLATRVGDLIDSSKPELPVERLLSAIMRTAVIDGLIRSSPCKVDDAGTERAAERPIATIAEVEAFENAMPEHLRFIIPRATWCQLRRGEILGDETQGHRCDARDNQH